MGNKYGLITAIAQYCRYLGGGDMTVNALKQHIIRLAKGFVARVSFKTDT